MKMHKSFLIAALALLAACGSSVDTQPMEDLAETLFRASAENRVDRMLDMYGDEFYGHVTRDEWRVTLEDIRAELGPYRTHSFVKPVIVSSMREGTTVTLIYDVEYANHRVVEQLTYRVGAGPGLIRHQFNTQADLPGQAMEG